jgi:hypothetical protein
MSANATLSLTDRPTRGAGEDRVTGWMREVAADRPAPLGVLDDETAYALRCARLEPFARLHGAEHENLRDVERRQFASATLMAATAARVVEALRVEHVPCAVLKGLPLAQRYWGDAFVRPSVDIDLLVARGDYARARLALTTHGFAVHEEWVPAWYLTRWFYHETFVRTDVPRVAVELHWDYLRPGLGDTDVPGLLDAVEDVYVASRALPAPASPWQLLVVAVHAVHEFFGARHLLDVALVARALENEDWRRAVEIASSARLGPTLWYGVVASAEWLGWEVPGELAALRPSAARDAVARRYVRRLPPFGRPSRLDLQLQHVVAPALSSDGARAVTRIPFALLTDRGNLAMRLERGRLRLQGVTRGVGDRPG